MLRRVVDKNEGIAWGAEEAAAGMVTVKSSEEEEGRQGSDRMMVWGRKNVGV